MTVAILTFGYPGSGKGTALNVAQHHNISTITMGDIVRKNAKRAYSITGNPNEFNSLDNDIVGPYATTMRELHGYDVMARLTIEEIQSTDLANTETIVIDGLRSADELELLENAFDTVVAVYIDVSQTTRLQRLRARGRDETESELTIDALKERDKREENWGLKEVIENEQFDKIISNEGSIVEFKAKFEEILAEHFTTIDRQYST